MSTRRRAIGWVMAGCGLPLLTLLLANIRSVIGLQGILLSYLLLVVATSAAGGIWPALVAALGGSLAANWYFTPPFHTWEVAHPENALALAVSVGTALIVSMLVNTANRRTIEAHRASAEADMLARVSGTLVGREDPVPELMELLRSLFSLDAVALLRRAASGWRVEAHAGTPCPTTPNHGDAKVSVSDGLELVLVGRKIETVDRRVLQAFTAQVTTALEGRRLQSEAAAAQRLKAIDELRTALLVAVSHDLRTPLSSIKASVSSLLQDDVEWSATDERDFLVTIDTETDRLNRLVGNLLDMSRLQIGRLSLSIRELPLEAVVAAAISGQGDGHVLDVNVPESLAHVHADATLLERAIANVVDNALRYSPPGSDIAIRGAGSGEVVLLAVSDRGPGIPVERRDDAFTPFQRLGDHGSGVGLGLAVARGFVEAMGGRLTLSDTDGGGLTVTFELKAVG